MEKQAIHSVKDKDTRDIFDGIFEGAMGTPIAFSSAPTLDDMDANSWGFSGTNIYIKFSNGTGIILSGVAMT